MRNPLDSFKEHMLNYNLVRNNNLITTVKGLPNTEKGTNRKFIALYPEIDIQINDILINTTTNIKYIILDIDSSSYKGTIFQKKAYYQTSTYIESQSNTSTTYNYNISNPQNSIIGNQEFATINNKSFNIDELKKLIELYGDNDKAKLYQLASELEKAIHNDNIKKGILSQFSDLIAKHSWLPLAIAQILSAFITK